MGCAAGACPPLAVLGRDVLLTALHLDLSTLSGRADITVAGSPDEGLSFEVGDSTIDSVTMGGVALAHRVVGRQLDIGVPASSAPLTVTIEYRFHAHSMLDGWIPASGVSLLWPHYCGNLFPCHSRPSDGSRFTLDVVGVPSGATAVYPTSIDSDAPTYMPALAVGTYTYRALGTTSAGTDVGVYHLPGSASAATSGTSGLTGYVDFFETTLGAYSFGPRVASVEAPWGGGAYGGMEHHPYFHVSSIAMSDRYVQAHEAAHGWFGNGVRIACWEDFVLSEGLATYLGARAVEEVDGTTASDALWASFGSQLDAAVASGDTIALPDGTCDAIDIATHPLWSNIPYMKGAFFLRELELAVGRSALASFYVAHVGGAARMQDLLTHIQMQTGFDPSALATAWLRSLGHP
ncbi:MAG: M1 family metallopeptidase [Sandaracinaceae bacterium]